MGSELITDSRNPLESDDPSGFRLAFATFAEASTGAPAAFRRSPCFFCLWLVPWSYGLRSHRSGRSLFCHTLLLLTLGSVGRMDQLLPTPAHIPRPCRIPTIILPRLMVCVQQVVGPLPQRLSQILVVQLLDIRVLVGVSNFCLCVQLPQLLASRRGHLNGWADRRLRRSRRGRP